MGRDVNLSDTSFTVNAKVWIEKAGVVALSELRVTLLEAVDLHGSLTRAAEALDMPYRTAWKRIKESEAALGLSLVETTTGGATGGRSQLTPEARDLCQRFRRVSGGIQEVVVRRFSTEFQHLNNPALD